MVNLHEKNEQLQQLAAVTEQTGQVVVLGQQGSPTLNLFWPNPSIYNHQFCHINHQCNTIYLADSGAG